MIGLDLGEHVETGYEWLSETKRTTCVYVLASPRLLVMRPWACAESRRLGRRRFLGLLSAGVAVALADPARRERRSALASAPLWGWALIRTPSTSVQTSGRLYAAMCRPRIRCAPRGRREVTVVQNEAGRWALADRCSHRGRPLSEGTMEGACVTWPWHGSHFDVATGEPTEGPASTSLS